MPVWARRAARTRDWQRRAASPPSFVGHHQSGSDGGRTLARMPEKRSTLELFLHASPAPRLEGVLRIRPVVVDTSFLVVDLLEAARRGRETDFLQALEHGSLRGFAAHHVWAEMGRKCRDVPLARGLDPERASDIWWAEYVPRLHFVDTAGLDVPLADAILPRDPSDAGTFALAGLLAPVVVLSTDLDIIDPGVATRSYRVLVEDAGVITLACQGAWSGLIAMSLGVEGVKAIGRGLARAAAHATGPPVFFAVLLAGVMTTDWWVPRLRDRAPRLWRDARSLAEQATPHIAELARQYQSATAAWDESAFEGVSSFRQQAVARLLAAASAPMSRSAITAALEPTATARKRRQLMAELTGVLGEVPAFDCVGRWHWKLGRRGVDFGGVVDPEDRLLSPGVPRALLARPSENN
jgi:hypothetical protein